MAKDRRLITHERQRVLSGVTIYGGSMYTGESEPGESLTTSTEFGSRVRDLRLQVGLSQKQLADFSTLSVRAIRNIENGLVKNPRRDTVRLIFKALNLNPQEHGSSDALVIGRPSGALALPPGVTTAACPITSGPLLGRENDFTALRNLFGAELCRLVTITGLEGVGKTRLALEFARMTQEKGHATVLWVPPAGEDRRPHGRAAAAPPTPHLRDLMAAGEEGAGRVGRVFHGQRTLIVIDGGLGSVKAADFLTRLLAEQPSVSVLVTSRSPLRMSSESLFPLAPLAVPDPADEGNPARVEQAASVRLFLTRLGQVRPGFRLDNRNAAAVARTCRTLDGLPLALELAARWGLVYTPQQLADQLSADPTLAGRPPDSGGTMARAFESVRRALGSLTPGQEHLLLAMAREDRQWTVAEAAWTTAAGVPECASDIYTLLMQGFLRRRDDGDQSHFEVLHIVRGSLGLTGPVMPVSPSEQKGDIDCATV